MSYIDEQKKHVEHSFDLFCKRVICSKAYIQSIRKTNGSVNILYLLTRDTANIFPSTENLTNTRFCNTILNVWKYVFILIAGISCRRVQAFLISYRLSYFADTNYSRRYLP